MTLATRCPACETAFRVVQDQLKVSDGWVRCGRCGEVFSALDGLFDLARETATGAAVERSAPAAETTTVEAAGVETTGVQGTRSDDVGIESRARDVNVEPEGLEDANAESSARDVNAAPESDAARDAASKGDPARDASSIGNADAESSGDDAGERPADRDAEIDAHLFGAPGHGASGEAPALAERDRADFSDARFDSEMADSAPFDSARSVDVDAAVEPLPEGDATPAFLRTGEARTRTDTARARTAWTAGVGGLALVLLLQAGHHFRDGAAALSSAAGALLAGWCELAGCEVGAPRRIDEVSVDSTAFAKVNGSESFRLTVGLRSRATVPVALPSVDLTLTDGNGRPVARKVLGRDAFTPSPRAIDPGAEVVLQAVLGTRELKVAGYTVEIFYP